MSENNDIIEHKEMVEILLTFMSQAEIGQMIGCKSERKYVWALLNGHIKNPSSRFSKGIESIFNDLKKKSFTRTKSYAQLRKIRADKEVRIQKFKEKRRNGKTNT